MNLLTQPLLLNIHQDTCSKRLQPYNQILNFNNKENKNKGTKRKGIKHMKIKCG